MEAQKRSLRIIISSGGTDVPIDDVRCISNSSRGTTGSLLAEVALNNGHAVDYVYSQGANRPFHRGLFANPKTDDMEGELTRIREAMIHYQQVSPHLNEIVVQNFDQYRQRLLQAVAEPDADAVILAMAASDYGPIPTEGKISSHEERFVIELHQLPKIISEVKQTRSGIFLVGFKFLIGVSDDELIETALKSMHRDQQDLAVANVAVNMQEVRDARTFILTPDGDAEEIKQREDLAPALIARVEERI